MHRFTPYITCMHDRYTRVQTDRGESNRDDTLSSFEMSKLMAVNKISICLNDQMENSIEED